MPEAASTAVPILKAAKTHKLHPLVLCSTHQPTTPPSACVVALVWSAEAEQIAMDRFENNNPTPPVWSASTWEAGRQVDRSATL